MTDLSALHVGDDILKLEPPRASLGELQLTNRMEMIRVEADVLGVVEHLKRIDPGLELLFDKRQEVYVLYWVGWREKDGHAELCEDMIGAYRALDQRLIRLIERVDREGRGKTDLATELDRLDAQADRERDRVFSEQVGQQAERLRHALRADLGIQDRAFIPGRKSKRGKR
jgi:hypothetical protein